MATRALITRSVTLTGVTFPLLPVPYDIAEYDTGGYFNPGIPGRFTIPAGINWAKFEQSIALTASASTGSMYFNLYKNGVETFCGLNSIRQSTSGYSNNEAFSMGPWQPVVEGDYFEARINVTGLGSPTEVLAETGTYFYIEGMA